MEFNELKSVWKKANDQEQAGYWVSEQDVKEMMHSKSRATIADVGRQLNQKVRMSGLIGAGCWVIALVVILAIDREDDFFFGINNIQYGIMMLIMGVCLLAIHLYSRNVRARVQALQKSAAPIKEALSQTHYLFNRVIKAGVWTDALVMPAVIIFVVSIRLYSQSGFVLDMRFLTLLVVAVAGPVIFYQLGRFMLSRKLGHFFRALDKRMEELRQLEAEEE